MRRGGGDIEAAFVGLLQPDGFQHGVLLSAAAFELRAVCVGHQWAPDVADCALRDDTTLLSA